MTDMTRRIRKTGKIPMVVVIAMITMIGGCDTTGAIVGGIIGVTVVGGVSPAHEVEQVYYLGIFDRQEQVPSTVYRVTVRGQASVMSNTKFASGWVPAEAIDTLNTHIGFDVNNPDKPAVKITTTTQPAGGSTTTVTTTGKNAQDATFELGRRLMMFGPEGFRPAPKNHRLVIVMGASPKKFFNAVDSFLGDVTELRVARSSRSVKSTLFDAATKLQQQRRRLDSLNESVKTAQTNGGK
ncbi:MAG: hypothetical protein QGH60_11445 [Phycisphaerae bacterium]|jgi:hypothetical protein|nr:hypothetical protein [Phycisphaerae bacterium]